MLTLQSPIQYVKGVGEKRALLFRKLGIETVADLLSHFPRQYEDWSVISKLSEVVFNTPVCIKARPLSKPTEHFIRKGMSLYRFAASDGTAVVQVTIFNNKYAANRIEAGTEYLFFGTVGGTFRRPEMSSPLIEPAETGARIRPIYPLTAGLTSRMIEKVVATALLELDTGLDADNLPADLRKHYGLCTRRYALENVHFPTDNGALVTARNRLVFEELLLLQLGLLRLKGRNKTQNTVRITTDYSAQFAALLPFTMTGAQQRAVADCLQDMKGDTPMNRLLQGDVGSGKTAVAACVAYQAIRGGYQCAMMAPTEILAEQHYHSLSKLLQAAGIHVGLLTGSMPKNEKNAVLHGLQDGTIHLVVGTHALLSDTVQFNALGLVITDEQHRFGVRQRAVLAGKGHNPHLLVMSATPIPRTLALMIYGDLDISVLNELPPRRTPIRTYAIGTDKRERAYGYIKKHLEEGRQAYIVCPLVEEGETDLVSAEAYAAKLAKGAFKNYSLGLLHGKMKSKDKEQVMRDFADNRIQLLVATTVVEVGVDVPNAVLMVIENAERFGLAQLHQLRGRVGRGNHASSCILISDAQNEEAKRRLNVMCHTTDGFKIADEDLKQRGPGDFFGNRQHGLPQMKIADLLSDISPLKAAQEAARALYRTDPLLEQPAHQSLALAITELFDRVGEHGLN